jgi:molybdate transport system permease protein
VSNSSFRFLAILLAAALVALLGVPIVALLSGTAPAALMAGLREPFAGQALRLSLFTTSCSLAIVVFCGTPLAWLLARGRSPLLRPLEIAAQLPVVMPPAVAGVALLLAFGRKGLLAPLGGHVAFTTAAVVLAEAFVAAPFYVQAATAAFRRLDPALLDVARTLGAGEPQAFFRVALPVARQGLLGGAAMAWARALGEFGATLMFAGNLPGRTQTLPLAIYSAMESDVRAAQALSVVLVGFAFVLLLFVRRGVR